jgi:hypothetical protein
MTTRKRTKLDRIKDLYNGCVEFTLFVSNLKTEAMSYDLVISLTSCSNVFYGIVGGESRAKFIARMQKIKAEGDSVARKIQAKGEGEAILLQSENEKKSLVAKAEAELEASKLQAQSIKIVGEMVKKYPEYRMQEFISDFGEALKSKSINKIIYVPTEKNIPIVEGKR